MSSPSTVSRRIREFREQRGLTQNELGARAGIAAASVSHFETGQRVPSLDSLMGAVADDWTRRNIGATVSITLSKFTVKLRTDPNPGSVNIASNKNGGGASNPQVTLSSGATYAQDSTNALQIGAADFWDLLLTPSGAPAAGGFSFAWAATVNASPEAQEYASPGGNFGALYWVEFRLSDGTTRTAAPVALPDPRSYYHGFKPPTLLSGGRVVRGLSDENGEYQSQRFEFTVDDSERYIRGLLAHSLTRDLRNYLVVERLISEAEWRQRGVPRTVALGLVRSYKTE